MTEPGVSSPAPTYCVQTWSGHPLYVCLSCGYDTSVLDALAEHCTLRHERVLIEERRAAAARPATPPRSAPASQGARP